MGCALRSVKAHPTGELNSNRELLHAGEFPDPFPRLTLGSSPTQRGNSPTHKPRFAASVRKETAQGYSTSASWKIWAGRGSALAGQVRLPLLLLQDRCAAASGLAGSEGMRWSAVNGSLARGPCPHIQHEIAVSLTCLARRL